MVYNRILWTAEINWNNFTAIHGFYNSYNGYDCILHIHGLPLDWIIGGLPK